MQPHVKAMINHIHNKSVDDSNDLGDFKPIEPPLSMGVERKR